MAGTAIFAGRLVLMTGGLILMCDNLSMVRMLLHD